MTGIFVLGSFVVDLACRTPHLPVPGETVFAGPFKLGPGGKGSNQAVAARRAGVPTTFLTKLGRDPFARIARDLFRAEGIDDRFVFDADAHETGAALIMVDAASGQNMITVAVGACAHITPDETAAAAADISRTPVFLTQLETNLEAVEAGLSMAVRAGATTILNPAPARAIPDGLYALVDYLTPNETEAATLTSVPTEGLDAAIQAGEMLLFKGVRRAVVLTLGERGAAILRRGEAPLFVPAYRVPEVVDTTGAGDAFNGAFAAALAEGMDLSRAVDFACAGAALSVAKPGTAPAMPQRHEINGLIARQRPERG